MQRRFQRVWHLLDPPSALWGDPVLRARVEEIGTLEEEEEPGWTVPDRAGFTRLPAAAV